MVEEGRHAFKLQRSRSSLCGLAGGWKSSGLQQDSLSPHNGDSVPLPRYERLSQSMRVVFSEEPRQKKRGWVGKVTGHVLFLHKFDSDGDGGESKGKERKKKKRSSWLPDPERRWPVQGW